MFACEHSAIGARVVARQRRRLVLQRVRTGGRGERGTHNCEDFYLMNILDQNYRNFASNISAPGRNFIVTLRGSF